jgi:ATP/maltotriose-dependent transcriptional regulator MalT
MGEARSWVGQLQPAGGSFDPQAQAELAWAAAATALEVGDDQTALAARERLTPLLDEIADPYLRAVSQLILAWAAGIVGDFDGGIQLASVSLEQLRGQDEPFWTALAAYTTGLVEMIVGRYDDARRHLTQMRDLAERLDNPWLAAVSRVLLGTLAVAQGRPEEARAPLDEGLELSLATHSTRSVTLCLAAFARLVFVEGDPEQAARLAGAAEGLRHRVGLRAWPLLRPEEAELVAQVRQAVGADRFGELFAAGSRLSQQEAVAAARDRRGG